MSFIDATVDTNKLRRRILEMVRVGEQHQTVRKVDAAQQAFSLKCLTNRGD